MWCMANSANPLEAMLGGGNSLETTQGSAVVKDVVRPRLLPPFQCPAAAEMCAVNAQLDEAERLEEKDLQGPVCAHATN